ncbi:MAG: metallophosphoesterase [Actinomycetota bacterium]|nr:metallophosphoesterase [Actinomycetota bacterium]
MSSDPAVRVVQLSDTHLSAALGVPAQWPATRDWINADPPDLVVHTGDIVLADPDDRDDREFAMALMAEIEAPFVAVPGNHDVGFFDESEHFERRIATFCEAWGADRFSIDLARWRVVGANTYRFGDEQHDRWLASAVESDRPTLLFTHQPLAGEPADGWELPVASRAAAERAIAPGDVRIVATGHRHRHWASGRAVWCPSLTILGSDPWDPVPGSGWRLDGSDGRHGIIEHRLGPDGTHDHAVIRPWV